jgi:hypothetical protein
VHLDAAIDDINAKLSSKFPAFSEFTQAKYPQYPDYNFFPDRFIRSVVCSGAAYKFYVTDEEGAQTAPSYMKDYNDNLFVMQRDFSDRIPEEFQDFEQGAMIDPTINMDNYNVTQLIWGDI